MEVAFCRAGGNPIPLSGTLVPDTVELARELRCPARMAAYVIWDLAYSVMTAKHCEQQEVPVWSQRRLPKCG